MAKRIRGKGQNVLWEKRVRSKGKRVKDKGTKQCRVKGADVSGILHRAIGSVDIWQFYFN